MKAALALIFVVALGAPAAAQTGSDNPESRYSKTYHTCLDKPSGQSTMGMIDCIAAELKIHDAALNQAYRTTMARLNPRQQAALQKAQRAWIAFRDADCAAQYDQDWGTLSQITANACVLRMTAVRTIFWNSIPLNRKGIFSPLPTRRDAVIFLCAVWQSEPGCDIECR